MKSNFLETDLLLTPSSSVALRFNRIVESPALVNKPGEAFPSISSRGSGRGVSGLDALGSLEGCVGYGRAKK